MNGATDGPAAEGQLPAAHEHNPNRYERLWGVLLAVVLTTFGGLTFGLALTGAATPPSARIPLDPSVPLEETEFADMNLGVQDAGGVSVARILAARFQFVPACVVLPALRPVELRFASVDVVHGIQIAGTNANTMIVPGWVSVIRTEFAAPGAYQMLCHEFCGMGHNAMWARVVVVPERNWAEGAACP